MDAAKRKYCPSKNNLEESLVVRPEGLSLDLEPLNVLIGPNGSGKSNLLDGIELLKSAPVQVTDPIRSGGGIRNWIWGRQPGPTAWVETILENPMTADICSATGSNSQNSNRPFGWWMRGSKTSSRTQDTKTPFFSTASKMADQH